MSKYFSRFQTLHLQLLQQNICINCFFTLSKHYE